MAKKPDPSTRTQEPPLLSFDVYKAADEPVWLCRIKASDKYAAMEKAAIEFKMDLWRLYAVRRR